MKSRKKKRGWEKINKFVHENFKLSLKYLKETKNFFWFSFFLFFLMALIGYLFPVFFEEQILELIKELVEKTKGLGFLGLISFIMINNIQSAFSGLIFGVFLGIVPLIIVIVNGYILGFVANKTIALEGFLVLWKLLPHGILEIPAIIISIGLGLKLGMFFFIYKGKNKRKEFVKWISNSLKVFVFIIVPLLVIAAIIEGSLIFLLG